MDCRYSTKGRYIAYDSTGKIIGNHINSWVNLAQGVCESHPGEAFTIYARSGGLVYQYTPLSASIRVKIAKACDALEIEAAA